MPYSLSSCPEAPVHTLITTHQNADLDGIASMLAAKKLYPEARIVLPGSDSSQLKHFFIQSLLYLFDLIPFNEIKPEEVKLLIIVDTASAERIGELAPLALSKNIKLHIYDHHPSSPRDLKASFSLIEDSGATISLMIPLLKKKQIKLTPEEATLMSMGIFEDTGNLTSINTRARDFKALAWLVEQGAHLPTVGDLLAREMNQTQLRLLNEMIDNSSELLIHGTEVIITRISQENYVPDLAFLLHRFMKMERITIAFLLARMDGKVHLIGRSKISDVNIGLIMQAFNGGGHKTAGAATVRDYTLSQVEDKLYSLLNEHMPHRFHAEEIMSTPAHIISPETNFRIASQTMTRYKVNALLVTDKADPENPLLGLVTRQIVEQGLSHSMDKALVKDYLISDFNKVEPKASLTEIQAAIVEGKQRIVPVVDDSRILGVITRTDLLQLMVKKQEESHENEENLKIKASLPKTRNILNIMKERLPLRIMTLLTEIGMVADTTGCKASIVGGFVRDLLLYRKNDDIDIVVEGDGMLFAENFAKSQKNARVHLYSKFSTAVITLEDNFKIDVATARTEYYAFPAALPEVEKSSLKADLYRRDFTINTLAIALNFQNFGILIDHFSGQKDLKDKTLRIIHNLSFVEDPTRIFRAVRFESRFEFTIGKLTARLIKNAVSMGVLQRLSGPRAMNEIITILEENDPIPAIKRLEAFKLFSTLHPSLSLTAPVLKLLTETRKIMDGYDLLVEDSSCQKWLVYFMVLLLPCGTEEVRKICRILHLTKGQEDTCTKERAEALLSIQRLHRDLPLDNSILYARLNNFKTEILLYMMARAGKNKVRKAIAHYLSKLRGLKPLIKGQDIKAMGVAPGPRYKKILTQVLDARLNGIVKTREEELAFVKNIVKDLVKD